MIYEEKNPGVYKIIVELDNPENLKNEELIINNFQKVLMMNQVIKIQKKEFKEFIINILQILIMEILLLKF